MRYKNIDKKKYKRETNITKKFLIKKVFFDSYFFNKEIYESKFINSRQELLNIQQNKTKKNRIIFLKTKKNKILPKKGLLTLNKFFAGKIRSKNPKFFMRRNRFFFKKIKIKKIKPILKKLLLQQPITRFHKIKGVSIDQLVNHKNAIIRRISEKNSSLAIVATTKQNVILAFHFAYLKKTGALCFYELMTSKNFLAKMASIEILLRSYQEFYERAQMYETSVYEHNYAACCLFKRLGFHIKNKVFYKIIN